jgi:hypothetical protein
MEEVVALELPSTSVNDEMRQTSPAPAPPGSTALLLACAPAMYEMERDPNFEELRPAQVLIHY